ncbi:MAG: hypothetical protein WC753_02305 [Candidatus Gracilibacteria bacterium]
MKPKRPNTIVILALLFLSLIVTFFEAIYKGLKALITGRITPLRQTRLFRIWHWAALDGPRRFWQSPSRYHFFRSPATLLEVILYPKKKGEVVSDVKNKR